MSPRTLTIALMASLAACGPARAALVLEYIRVSSITAGPSAGPALSGPLVMDPTGVSAPATVFLQIALRDTLGSGPEYGQPGTVNWQTNNGWAGYGSIGLGAFFIRFDSAPGLMVNPAPTAPANARLVYGTEYASVSAGSNPPTFTRFGGLINFGFEPGAVPDPVNNRIALFNLRIVAIYPNNGSGTFRLRDPNPTAASIDNALLLDSGFMPQGYYETIDPLLFGTSFSNTYDLSVTVIPEPSSLALVSFAVGVAARQWARRTRLTPPRPRVPDPAAPGSPPA